MGTWTLSNYQDALADVFASRGITNPRFLRWVNQAKREVESSVQFEGSKSTDTFDTVADQRAYTLPTGFLSIVAIRDLDNDKSLIRTDIENINLRDRDDSDVPKFWARSGNELILAPTPDDAYEIERVLIIESADFAAAGDTTDIPSHFDNAIYFLAVAYGWMELDQEAKAKAWMDRYIGYMRTRMMDDDWEGTSRSEPVRVINDLSELRSR